MNTLNLKVGQKVKLKEKHAKWYLEHPDCYIKSDGSFDNHYEPETLLHLSCCLGVPCIGTIISYGTECYGVEWKCGPFMTWYYIGREDFTVLR